MERAAVPLLTIAIPTFNRAEFLRELLASVFDQLMAEPCVELIISDNASEDHTPAVVAAAMEQGLPIVYFRNKNNIGSDGNFLQCFKQAKGRFVWLLGDDDVLYSDSLQQVIHLLTTLEPDLLFIRPLEFRGSPPGGPSPRDRYARRPLALKRPEHYAWMVGNMFSLITCNVINKERLERLQYPPLEDMVGTGLVHLGWTLPLLACLETGVYVYDHLIGVRGGNRSGYTISKVFGPHFKDATDVLLSAHPSLARILQTDVIVVCLPFLILESRRQSFGDFAEEAFHTELKPIYGDRPCYWLATYPVARLPLQFAELWFTLIRLERKVQALLKRLGR